MRIGRYNVLWKLRRGRGITESRHTPTYRIHAPSDADATSRNVRARLSPPRPYRSLGNRPFALDLSLSRGSRVQFGTASGRVVVCSDSALPRNTPLFDTLDHVRRSKRGFDNTD